MNRLSDIQDLEKALMESPDTTQSIHEKAQALREAAGWHIAILASKSDMSFYDMLRFLTHVAALPDPKVSLEQFERSLYWKEDTEKFLKINTSESPVV